MCFPHCLMFFHIVDKKWQNVNVLIFSILWWIVHKVWKTILRNAAATVLSLQYKQKRGRNIAATTPSKFTRKSRISYPLLQSRSGSSAAYPQFSYFLNSCPMTLNDLFGFSRSRGAVCTYSSSSQFSFPFAWLLTTSVRSALVVLIALCSLLSIPHLSAQNVPVSDQMIHSTAKLNFLYKSEGKTVEGSGTSFFYNFKLGERIIPCLVTNKHVVDKAIIGRIQFTLQTKEGHPDYGNTKTVEIGDFNKQWIMHPNPDVDLCIFPVAPLLKKFENAGIPIYQVSIDESIMPNDSIWDSFQSVEEIAMVGYPNGVYDAVNNIPIFRKGDTATPLRIQYEGKDEFIVNITSIPGSSGSPVFVYNEGSFLSNGRLNLGTRIFFVGVLYAGPMQQMKGSGSISFNNIPIEVETTTDVTIGLGVCIRSSKLKEFEPILEKLIGSK